METIPYTYDQEQFNDEVTLVSRSGNKSGGTVTALLSPFQMPVRVDVQIRNDDFCVFHFIYPNNEPSETRPRKTDDPAIQVVLGRYSRKVIEVRLSNARSRLETGQIGIDHRSAEDWCNEVSMDSRVSCARNALVANKILKEMPQDLRRHLVRLTDEMYKERAPISR